jgi:multidrug resistance efflux pump
MISRILLLLIAAAAGWYGYQHYRRPLDTTLTAFGTLEARNVDIGSKVGGRISEVLAHEGDQVKAGQLLVVFEADELSAQVEQALGRVHWAEANVAKMKQGSRPEEIAEAQAAAGNGTALNGFRVEEVEQARAELARARAEAINTERLYARTRELTTTGAASKQSLDDAEAKRNSARATVVAAEHAVAAAEGRLKAAAAVTKKTETGFRLEDLAAAEGELAQAQAQLKEMQARWAEHEVRAPADAVVEVLDLQPGDLIPPNTVIAKLLKRNELYAMVYVPETRVSEVHPGQNAELRVDAFPGKTFAARVEQVRQQAEFLPRNVQTSEERVHQVIGVKLRVDESNDQLRPGISVEAHFPPAPAL